MAALRSCRCWWYGDGANRRKYHGYDGYDGYDGRGRIWTRLDALNAALGIVVANEDERLNVMDVFR